MRKKKIVDLVNIRRQISASELALFFDVSIETIRRDLNLLDKQHKLVRVHGGAISKNNHDTGSSFDYRVKSNINDKKILVDSAIPLITKNSTIGLDASSSSWLLARTLSDIQCTIITNCIYIVSALEGKKNINVIGIGGNYSEKYKSFYGISAINSLEKFTMDLCFISCSGLDFGSGAWESNELNLEMKKCLIRRSHKTALFADSTKIGKRGLKKLCDISDLDYIITSKKNIKQ